MIKVDRRGLDKKIKRLKDFQDSLDGKNIIKELAKEAAELVYKRVKSGKGVDSDTSDSPSGKSLKPLSFRYKKFREKYDGQTGPFFSVGKSNLTLTGQMLGAMKWKITKLGFEIYIAKTSRNDSDSTNAEIAEYVAKQGRPFLALTVKEQRIIAKSYENKVRELARKKFKLT